MFESINVLKQVFNFKYKNESVLWKIIIKTFYDRDNCLNKGIHHQKNTKIFKAMK